MSKHSVTRKVLGAALAGGTLFSGPCGITGLQFRDFLESTLIRTSVSTAASVFEAAFIDDATQDDENP